MFRTLKTFKVTDVKNLPVLYSPVRFATKPRWIPMAKTKRLRIKYPFMLAEEQQIEAKRLFNVYATQLKTTLEYFRKNYREQKTSDEVIEKLRQEEEEEWQACMDLNDEWNKQVAVEREQRNALEFEEEVKKAVEKMKEMDEENRKSREMVDNLIREQKELSKTFITEANIDKHIHEILNANEPVTYNWAMDQKGNVYEGYSMTPNPNKKLTDISSTSNAEKQEGKALG